MTIKYVQYGRLRYNIFKSKNGLSKLKIAQRGILNITEIIGLNQVHDLEELDLSNNKISEITGLDNLTTLKKLDLSGNQIEEIKGLEDLTNLQEVYLNKNQIKDIKGLEILTNLRVLDLSDNAITDSQTLKKLKENHLNLTDIELRGNPCFNPIDGVKAEVLKTNPSKTRILSALSHMVAQLGTHKVSYMISIFSEFLAEILKLNPDFYMFNLYLDTRKILKEHFGEERRKLIEKKIVEDYFLLDGEQILYEHKGNVKATEIVDLSVPYHKRRYLILMVVPGNFIITNYRIIAQGKLLKIKFSTKEILAFRREYDTVEDKTGIIDGSREYEIPSSGNQIFVKNLITLEAEVLPCYGWQFPVLNRIYLERKGGTVTYFTKTDNVASKIELILLNSPNKVADTNEILTIFRMNTIQVINLAINSIKEMMEAANSSDSKVEVEAISKEIAAIFKQLQKDEECCHISNSEYLNIVGETYKLNPQFFVKSIYPKMGYWTIPKKVVKNYLSVNFGVKL